LLILANSFWIFIQASCGVTMVHYNDIEIMVNALIIN